MMSPAEKSPPFEVEADGFVTAQVVVRGTPKQARLGQHSGNYAALWIANDPMGAVTDELVDECRNWLETRGFVVEEIPAE
jgi:hypothetical protein